jgi:hypothetical protein
MSTWANGTFAEFTAIVALITGPKGLYVLDHEQTDGTVRVKRAAIVGGTVASAAIAGSILWDFGINGPTETAFRAGAGSGFVKVEGLKGSEGY